MKKLLLILFSFLISNASFAQWTTNAGNTITSTTNQIGIGTSSPATSVSLQVMGTTVLGGANIAASNGFSTSFLANSKLLLIGWNRSAGNGETDFIANQGTGGLGGFRFYNHDNSNNETVLMTMSGNGKIGVGITNPLSLLTVGGNPSPLGGQQLGVYYTPTDTSSARYAGLTSQLDAQPAANSSATYYGSYALAGTDASTGASNFTGKLIGAASSVQHRGTGLVSSIYGFFTYSPAFTSTGTATVSYGVFISPQRVAHVSSGYGIYQYGATDTNYFAGDVSIGTLNPKGYKLAVNGSAIATSMTVKLNSNWPDYVFEPNYRLSDLATLKTYININHHLPDLPSADDVAKNGLNLGEINEQLTKKVEELTLYMIDKDQQLKDEQSKVKEQENKISAQQEQIELIKQQLKAIAIQLNKPKS